MGKGSGGCDDRPSMIVGEQSEPVKTEKYTQIDVAQELLKQNKLKQQAAQDLLAKALMKQMTDNTEKYWYEPEECKHEYFEETSHIHDYKWQTDNSKNYYNKKLPSEHKHIEAEYIEHDYLEDQYDNWIGKEEWIAAANSQPYYNDEAFQYKELLQYKKALREAELLRKKASPIEPISIDEFTRSHNGYTIFTGTHVVEPKQTPSGMYRIYIHMAVDDEGKTHQYYPCTADDEEAAKNCGPIGLLHDTEFESFHALRNAISGLVEDDVKHRLLQIVYKINRTDKQNGPYSVKLTRNNVAGGWSINATVKGKIIMPMGYGTFHTRQQAIDAFNQVLQTRGLDITALPQAA